MTNIDSDFVYWIEDPEDWYIRDLGKQIDLEPDFLDALNELTLIEGKDFPSKQRFNLKEKAHELSST